MLTDRDIMMRVQAGETSLFAHLVARYEAKLLRFATSKFGQALEADDLVQDTFLAVFQGRDSYSPQFAVSTWIWTILLNLSKRQYRQSKTRVKRVEEYAQRTRRNVSVEQAAHPLLQAELSEQLQRWLAQLPEPQADAIRLRFFGELPYEEIAQAMQCSLSGAKRRVKTGLLKLAELATDDS